MLFQLSKSMYEKKLLSWSAGGALFFISSFLWIPSRDGLQSVYLLAFFLPIIIILLARKPKINEYGGWPTIIALTYAGFSTASTVWNAPNDLMFFILQWCVLATWLCGTCLVFTTVEIDIQKYLQWFIALGALVILITILHYYYFVFGISNFDKRLWGWNVFRNANEIGAMCGIIALLAFTIALQSSDLKHIWLFYALTLLASCGLIASFSRGALFAFCLVSFLALITVRPPLKTWLPPILIILAVILLLPKNLYTGYIDGRGEGLGMRAMIWTYILDQSYENIFTGIGMSRESSITITDIGVFNHAHSGWLDTLYRTGIIGLVLVLSHLLSILYKFSRDPRLLPLYLWLIYGCIYNLFDGRSFFWEIGGKWFLYWIPAGLIIALHTSISARTSQMKS